MHIFGRKSKEKKSIGEKSRSDVSAAACKRRPVFGVPLVQATANNRCFDGVPVPRLVRHCIDYVEAKGLRVEGIYRVSPPKLTLDELVASAAMMAADGELMFQDAHEAAGLLKRFIRQLPENVLTTALRLDFAMETEKCKCLEACKCGAAQQLAGMMRRRLPRENYCLLSYIFTHAQHIIREQAHNKMGVAALGTILQATLGLKNEAQYFKRVLWIPTKLPRQTAPTKDDNSTVDDERFLVRSTQVELLQVAGNRFN